MARRRNCPPSPGGPTPPWAPTSGSRMPLPATPTRRWTGSRSGTTRSRRSWRSGTSPARGTRAGWRCSACPARGLKALAARWPSAATPATARRLQTADRVRATHQPRGRRSSGASGLPGEHRGPGRVPPAIPAVEVTFGLDEDGHGRQPGHDHHRRIDALREPGGISWITACGTRRSKLWPPIKGRCGCPCSTTSA